MNVKSVERRNKMRRKVWLLWLVVAIMMLMPAEGVFAQGGEGDKVVVGRTYVLPAGQVLDGNLTVIGGAATLEETSVVHGDISFPQDAPD